MTTAARIYGDSLYDLALEENLSDVLMEQSQQVRELFRENPDYVKLLQEPSIPKTERVALIDKAFGGQAERYLVNFLKLLCERGLLGEYSGCCEEFTKRYDSDHGIANARVTSVVELTQEQKSALQQKLEQLSGKQIRLETKTDPGVLGGLRVELDGELIDGTVQGRLEALQKRLGEQ